MNTVQLRRVRAVALDATSFAAYGMRGLIAPAALPQLKTRTTTTIAPHTWRARGPSVLAVSPAQTPSAASGDIASEPLIELRESYPVRPTIRR
ncbi:MAG: hypothetical protein ACE5LU_15250 [Anaerolineae bacterium]